MGPYYLREHFPFLSTGISGGKLLGTEKNQKPTEGKDGKKKMLAL
jgi:hypothetical protein